jgi:N-acetylglucosamine-6-phosphate deacetylase
MCFLVVRCSVEECYGSLSCVKIVTLAPELPGAPEATSALRARGIVVSMGHSMAHVADADRGVSRCDSRLLVSGWWLGRNCI